jgi:hypothetical protein
LVWLSLDIHQENPKRLVKDVHKTHISGQVLVIVLKRGIVGKVDTTPKRVDEANWALFHATMNLPHAAAHCGMTQREMKMTFREFLKTHPVNDYESLNNTKR